MVEIKQYVAPFPVLCDKPVKVGEYMAKYQTISYGSAQTSDTIESSKENTAFTLDDGATWYDGSDGAVTLGLDGGGTFKIIVKFAPTVVGDTPGIITIKNLAGDATYCTISFCDYVRGASYYQFFGMIQHGFGYRDFANCTKQLTTEVYVPEDFYGRDEDGDLFLVTANDLTHRYDENSGTFIEAVSAATHAKCYDTLFVQVGGDDYECYAETQNIQYYAEKMDSNALTAFLKVAIGGGKYIWRFITESNYRFATNAIQWAMGALNETASFFADTLRFNGNRKYIVNRHEIQVAHGNCVRFRVDAVANGYAWEIYDIDLRSSGLISETTEVADNAYQQ